MDKKSNVFKDNIGWFITLLFIIVIVIFFVVLLSYEKTSNTTTTTTSSKQSTLTCSSGPSEDAFISLEGASQVKHEIKVMLIDDSISKFFYMYTGKLKNEEEAEDSSTKIHADYDTYLAKNKYSSSYKVDATFNHPGTSVRVDMYTGVDGINTDTATFFFLEQDKLDELMKMDGKELKKYYTDKKFKCDYEE